MAAGFGRLLTHTGGPKNQVRALQEHSDCSCKKTLPAEAEKMTHENKESKTLQEVGCVTSHSIICMESKAMIKKLQLIVYCLSDIQRKSA